MLVNGGSTGTHTVSTSPIYYPISERVFALGAVEAGGLLEIAAGMSSDLRAMLAGRYFSTDDSQSAGAWFDLDSALSGPGKAFKKGSVAPVTGLSIQLGIKLYTSTGTAVGRAFLHFPIVVTT
jgi:hypothetical protein